MPFKITVITVVFNSKDLIEDTIKSVINQNNVNLEYLVIDGDSNDGTLDVIARYKDKIDYFRSERDNGIYDAMNKGIKVATGDWILFLNAGDEFADPNILSRIHDQLNDCDIVYGKTIIRSKENGDIIRSFYPVHMDWKVIPYCHQSVLVKRDILVRSLFDTNYKIAADYAQYFKFKEMKVGFKSIEETISIYDNYGYSSSNYKKLLQEYKTISLLNHSNLFKRLQVFLYFSMKMYLNRG